MFKKMTYEMRKDLIDNLCEVESSTIDNEDLNNLLIAPDLLDVILNELRDEFYEDNLEYKADVDKLKNDYVNGDIDDISINFTEDCGVDIVFNHSNIHFNFMDSMIDWEDISNQDLRNIDLFINKGDDK